MVKGKLPVPGRPTIWITVGQGPIALAVGAGGGGLDIFSSPEPKAPGELIGWEGSVVRRPSVRPSVVRPHFQTTSPLKLLDRLQLNFIYSLQGL